ncbi:GNAT family N-acetyltransferase [Puerhibacterium sp. TATVAM-FAB25]|uniref:GNAT family N-acetyltransferase n=1 Tax=Puerhibacterium sp. TATVAM-FAB25 TaxID=3093699 RepID=UPI0039792D23
MTDFDADGSVAATAPGGVLPVVRRVRAEEWAEVRDVRLEMLRDPAAPMAFLDTYANAASQPETYWQNRTTAAAAAQTVVQYVAEVPPGGRTGADAVAGTGTDGAGLPGRWVGSATGILEQPGSEDFEGQPVEVRQVHVVGVWLHPDHRGRGVIQRMIDAVVAWGVEREVERARLYVHADNARAQGAYRKAGFVPSGNAFIGSTGRELEMVRALH